jgi:hypothetical protein
VAVFLAVWGATDVVRSGQKVFSAMFISTGKEKGQGLVEQQLSGRGSTEGGGDQCRAE